MNKLFYFVSASLLIFASCSKGFDAKEEENVNGTNTIEFSIEANAPAYDASTTKGYQGAVARAYWADGDEVAVFTVSDGALTYKGTLTAAETSDNYAKTTFSGTISAISANESVAFIYPASGRSGNTYSFSLASQTIATNGNAPFCAYAVKTFESAVEEQGSASVSSVDFAMASSFMCVNVYDKKLASKDISAATVMNIASAVTFSVTGTTIAPAAGESTGNIAVSYSSTVAANSDGKAMICFAIPATAESTSSSRTIELTASSSTYRGLFTSKAQAANKFLSSGVTRFDLSTAASFTVSKSGKKVAIAASNVYSDASGNLAFESTPYAYPTGTWSANHVGHFYWTVDKANSYIETYPSPSTTVNDRFWADGSDDNHMITINSVSYYVLSSAEYTYLLNTRTGGSTVGSTANARYAKVKGNGVNGLLIFPDIFAWPSGVTAPSNINTTGTAWDKAPSYTSDQMNAILGAGAVFLPCAGCRYGSDFDGAGTYGTYWSSAPDASNASYAYSLNLFSSFVLPASDYDRDYGFSLRLVRDIE